MKNILITGGAGFVGTYLTKRLVKEGYLVRILDNFSNSKISTSHDVELFKCDIRNKVFIKLALKGMDAVVHLAALKDVERSVKEPLIYHEVNAGGTLNLLYACVEAGIKDFIYSSSSSVYGEQNRLPNKEEYQLNPMTPYGASKLCGENYCQAFSYSFDMDCTILRFFNVYGDPSCSKDVTSTFFKRVKANKPPIIYGDGEQTRDFIHVEDVVSFIVKVMNHRVNGIFNVGTGIQTTINELARIIIKDKKIEPIHVDMRGKEIKYSAADMTKVKKMFNFEPRRLTFYG